MRPVERAETPESAGDPARRLEQAPALGQVAVVTGDDGGHYPHGNSVLVRGRHTSVLIDPSLTVGHWGSFPAHVDVALLSHVHEDHVAGLAAIPDADVHVHWRDQPALRSIDDLVASYGLRTSAQPAMRQLLLEEFGFQNRPDALPFDDGDRLDVGGSVITAIHLPGHTPGHCGFLIEPEGVMVLGDIDLTGFGPYYADEGSDLAAMETSLARCREIDAAWYVTFHHKGVVEGRRVPDRARPLPRRHRPARRRVVGPPRPAAVARRTGCRAAALSSPCRSHLGRQCRGAHHPPSPRSPPFRRCRHRRRRGPIRSMPLSGTDLKGSR